MRVHCVVCTGMFFLISAVKAGVLSSIYGILFKVFLSGRMDARISTLRIATGSFGLFHLSSPHHEKGSLKKHNRRKMAEEEPEREASPS